jgi:hypothetical protein
MWRVINTNQVSGIAAALFAVAVGAGLGLAAITGRQAPLVAGLAI